MTGEWKEYKLEDVAQDFAMGPFGSNIKAENFQESGVPVIRGKNLNFPKYVDGDFVFLSEEKADQLKSSNCYPNDLVFTHRGTIGQVAIVPEGKFKRYVVSQSGMKLTVNKKYLDHNYLLYFFKSNIGQHELLQNESQVGVPSISSPLTSLKSVTITLPPLPEQRAIASVLSSLDDKIDLLHRQSKTLEAMAETLFRQWFVEEEDEEWEDKKLGDFITVKHGYAFKGKSITTEKSDQILVTPGNFKIGGGFKDDKTKYFIGSDYPKDYIFSSDDLIVTMTDLSKDGDTLGYPALIPEHDQDEVLYLHNQRVGRVEFKKDISKYFFYYLMKTDEYKWFILGGASGTSIRHTSPTSICNYSFKAPPMERIDEFDAVVSEFISKMHKNQKQIHTLEKLRDTLLPKLMSGEVRVEL